MLNSVSSYGKNSIGFNAFPVSKLKEELDEAKKNDSGVGIAPSEGPSKGKIEFIVNDIKERCDSLQIVEGSWFFQKTREATTVLNIDENGVCPDYDIVRHVKPEELPLKKL